MKINKEQLRAQWEELHAELRQETTLGPQHREILGSQLSNVFLGIRGHSSHQLWLANQFLKKVSLLTSVSP
jgi:hypothetical protein